MSAWVNFLEVALALGTGWLGLMLLIVMRSERVAQVVNLPARDGDR